MTNMREERFRSNRSRPAHAEYLNQQVAKRLKQQSLKHWLPKPCSADILHSAVGNYQDLLSDAQVRHAGIFGEVRNSGLPALPRARHPGCAMPAGAESAPRIGEHTVKVLARFGFDAREIEDRVAAKAVRVSA